MIEREVSRAEIQVSQQRALVQGLYVDTVGKNAKKIEEYMKHRLEENRVGEQMTMGNY